MSGDPGSFLRMAIRDGLVPPAASTVQEQLEDLIAELLVSGTAECDGVVYGLDWEP